MTKRTQEILKQINSLQEDELQDMLYQMAKQHRLAKHIRMISKPKHYVFMLSVDKPNSISSREDLQQSLQKIQRFDTFKHITDPVLWQQQQRDDR